LEVTLNCDVDPQLSQKHQTYTLVQIIWYIETVYYNVVPMVFNAIGLADPGEKGEHAFLLATILDAILILSGINDHN